MESGRGISVVNQSTNPGLDAERHREVTLVTDLIDCSDRFGRHFCDSLSPYQPSPRFAARLNGALLLPPKTIGIGVFGRGENNASENASRRAADRAAGAPGFQYPAEMLLVWAAR